jgi:hypothetical protein
MLPRSESFDRSRGVQVVVQTDVDGVEVITLEQLTEISRPVRDAELTAGRGQSIFVQVTCDMDLYLVDLLPLTQMSLCDLPGADDTNPLHESPLFRIGDFTPAFSRVIVQ